MFTCATILTGGLMLFSLKLHPAPRPVTSGLWPHPPLCSPFLCPLHFLGRRAEWWWGPLGGGVGRTRGGVPCLWLSRSSLSCSSSVTEQFCLESLH